MRLIGSKASLALHVSNNSGNRIASKFTLFKFCLASHAKSRSSISVPASALRAQTIDKRAKIPVTVATGFLGSGKEELTCMSIACSQLLDLELCANILDGT